jgi:uncharacterized protein YbjT (DUF2867 family)
LHAFCSRWDCRLGLWSATATRVGRGPIRNCEVAIATIFDEAGLTNAFTDADGAFLMTPPDFDPEPGFPKTHEAIAAVKAAIATAQPAPSWAECALSPLRSKPSA